MQVEINSVDFENAKKMLSGVKNAAARVQTVAINKTLSGVRTDVSAEIRSDLNIAKKYVDKNIVTSKASFAKPSGSVVTRSKPIGLINFTGTKQIKKGVSVKVKKMGKRTVLKHAFIAVIKNANNVWWRKKIPGDSKQFRPDFPYGRLPKMYRLPIHRLTGPRLTDRLAQAPVIKSVEVKAGDRLIKNYDHELSRELAKL